MGQSCRGTQQNHLLLSSSKAELPAAPRHGPQGPQVTLHPSFFPVASRSSLQPESELCANIQAQLCTHQRPLLLKEQDVSELCLKLQDDSSRSLLYSAV